MADKYIKVANLKNRLNYIFRNYGTSKLIRDKVNEAIKSVPCYFKGELDTTLEVADVQEVKHGEWLKPSNDSVDSKQWICSECKGLTETAYYCGHCYYNYCPNCGARMDGVANG